MSEQITISKTLNIRDCGFDEFWLQDQIFNDPSIIGLGSLESIQREKKQSSGGRLDLLLKNPEDDSMYEVEIMLGSTDESHIIRTIEYWDLERRHWPKREHKSVLIAERINRRFFNVIQLMSSSIPIIAIQANIIEANGRKILHFTKILDVYEEPEDDLALSTESYDESGWEKKSPVTVACAKAFLNVARSKLSGLELRYFKFGLSIFNGKRCFFWFKHKDTENALFCFWIDTSRNEQAKKILEKADLLPLIKNENFRVMLNLKRLETHVDVFQQLVLLVNEAWNDGEPEKAVA